MTDKHMVALMATILYAVDLDMTCPGAVSMAWTILEEVQLTAAERFDKRVGLATKNRKED